MGRRNVQGEDLPWPPTEALGIPNIPALAVRCRFRFGALHLTEQRTQSNLHPRICNRIVSRRRRGAHFSTIRRKFAGFAITLRASTGHYRECRLRLLMTRSEAPSHKDRGFLELFWGRTQPLRVTLTLTLLDEAGPPSRLASMPMPEIDEV